MPTFKTNFPKNHTRKHWVTKNMSAQYLEHARRIAGLRGAAGVKGATVESVILDCMGMALPTLEQAASQALTKRARN